MGIYIINPQNTLSFVSYSLKVHNIISQMVKGFNPTLVYIDTAFVYSYFVCIFDNSYDEIYFRRKLKKKIMEETLTTLIKMKLY